MSTPAPRVVSCPTCGQSVPWCDASPYRPFCSDRCRKIDLGAWATGEYRIPAAPPDEEDPDSSLV